MGNVQFDAIRYQIAYVPQRLRSLEACVMACHAVLSGTVDFTPLKVDLGTTVLQQPNLDLFVGLAIDAGLVANRTLLNFLGLKLDNGQLINESYGLTIEKFFLPLVSVSEACEILQPEVAPDWLRDSWIAALSTASKSIAHFTETGATIRVARLGFACFATSKLIRRKFFQATAAAEPLTLIPVGYEPKLAGPWAGRDLSRDGIQ